MPPPRTSATLSGMLVALVWTAMYTGQAVASDFTMRRVGPPDANAKRLITVQIAIAPPPTPVEPAPDPEPAPETVSSIARLGPVMPARPQQAATVDLFWSFLPTGRGPIRLAQAAAILDSASDTGWKVTSAAHLRQISRRYGADIARATRGTGVSPALVLAVIAVESAGRRDAVSSAGAGGLMQLMPATAERFGVRDRFDPTQNIDGGVAYLDWLLDEFDGDAIHALAGYNAGEGAVRRHRGVPPFDETRAYVPKVVSAWRLASELCGVPQTLASDPCPWVEMASADP